MILIDGDPLTYRIGFAIENDKMGMIAGKYNMDKCINRIICDLAPSYGCEYKIYLGGEGNFRKTRAKLLPYKGNRAIDARPKHYDALRTLLVEQWGAEIIDGMEADDKLGIELTKFIYGEAICVSIDKDLLMVPGHHYNFVKKEFHYIDEITGYRNFAKQMLMGDATDNIPGLRGIGPKQAEKLLEKAYDHKNSLDNLVWLTYQSKVKDGTLKLKNKLEIQIENNDDIKLVLAELRDLLWIRRSETEIC